MSREQSWFEKDFGKLREQWVRTHGYEQLCADAAQVGVSGVDVPEVKHRCKKCDTPMVLRTGKFGAFLACPKGTLQDKHPTQSVPKGGVGGHLKVNVRSIVQYSAPYRQKSLEEIMTEEMLKLGLPVNMLGTDVALMARLEWESATEHDDPDMGGGIEDALRLEYGG